MRALIVLFSSILLANALNILVYNPKMATSHVRTLGKMADVLAEAGHNVTVLQVLSDPEVKVNGSTKATIIQWPCEEATKEFSEMWKTDNLKVMWKEDNRNPFLLLSLVRTSMHIMTAQCHANIHYPGLMESLEGVHFDFAMAEHWDLCGFVMFEKLGISTYGIALTTGMIDAVDSILGLPQSASYVPGVMSVFGDEMTFVERLQNGVAAIADSMMMNLFISTYDNVADKEGITGHGLREYLARSSLVFVNAEPLVDFPRPTLHKIVNVGGISVPKKSNKTLEEPWNSLLSLRPRTVLVSFGTVALGHMMPDDCKASLLETFKRFPDVTFIWKYEKPEHRIAEGIENVVTSEWIPQPEMLADRRLSLFVTHGGMGSTQEAMANGVPVVAIPVLADQMRNGKMLEKIGNGVLIQKSELNKPDVVAAAVEKVLSDPSYLETARRTEELLREQPFTPEERLVKNIEFAAAFGPLDQLDSHGRKLTTIQYYMLDVLAVIAAVTITLLSVVVFSARAVLRLCLFKKVKTE